MEETYSAGHDGSMNQNLFICEYSPREKEQEELPLHLFGLLGMDVFPVCCSVVLDVAFILLDRCLAVL